MTADAVDPVEVVAKAIHEAISDIEWWRLTTERRNELRRQATAALAERLPATPPVATVDTVEELGAATCPHNHAGAEHECVPIEGEVFMEAAERVARALARKNLQCGCTGCINSVWEDAKAAVTALDLTTPSQEWKDAADRLTLRGSSIGARREAFVTGARYAEGFLHVTPTPSPAPSVTVGMDQRAAFDATVELAREHDMEDAYVGPSSLSWEHLLDMQARITPDFSPSKLGRWLGWAQASLVAADIGVTLEDVKQLNKRFANVPIQGGERS